jgi:hypothetical protein
MKISDDELLAAIWLRQIRQLSTTVIDRYVGDSINVCSDDEHNFFFSSHQSITSRHLVTDKIGKQQLLKRLRWLRDMEKIKMNRSESFYIDNDDAKAAFHDARQWWLNNGVPTGYSKYTMESGRESTRANTIQVDNWEEVAKECETMLLQKYGESIL